MTTMEKTVCDVLAKLCERETVGLQDELVCDLNVDSLTFVSLVVELEARTGAQFLDDDLIIDMYPTAGHLAKYLARRTTSMGSI